MPENRLDVIGVGNAIVDVLARAEDAFLKTHDIPRGGFVLVDEARARVIYDAMAVGVEISGGSAANTIACVASLGGGGGFIGKVADDTLGEIFRHDMRAIGVAFDTPPLIRGVETGRCLINVTPDAQRSMATYLGAAEFLSEADIDEDLVKRAEITFLEGYRFETPAAQGAFARAAGIARANGKRTAMTLSDAGVVDRLGATLRDFIKSRVDILFANEVEAGALFGASDVETIGCAARAMCPLTIVTHSERGSVLIARNGEPVYVDAIKPAALVDTTGAGDAYAAGLLFGLARGFALDRAGALGSLAASEVISHFGARPDQSLKALAQKAGLL